MMTTGSSDVQLQSSACNSKVTSEKFAVRCKLFGVEFFLRAFPEFRNRILANLIADLQLEPFGSSVRPMRLGFIKLLLRLRTLTEERPKHKLARHQSG